MVNCFRLSQANEEVSNDPGSDRALCRLRCRQEDARHMCHDGTQRPGALYGSAVIRDGCIGARDVVGMAVRAGLYARGDGEHGMVQVLSSRLFYLGMPF